jgi:peptidoglycan/LPS O-acetylase OafA/YrhL
MNSISQMNSETESRFNERSTAIDALRGFAAIAVVVYHARAILWIGLGEIYRANGISLDLNAWIGYASFPLSFGGLGVSLFFVLSGYCIHRRGAKLLANSRAHEMKWKSFAVRRFWRIYPTYTCALVLTAVIDFWFSSRDVNQDNSLFSFIVSLFTFQGILAPTFGSNGVFWTLAMEIHLYAVYPLLYFASKKFGPDRVLFTTLTISVVYCFLERMFGFESLLPYRFQRGPVFLPYWFTWTIGFYLAEVEANRTKGPSNATWNVMTTIALPIGFLLTLKGVYLFAEIFWAVTFANFLRISLRPSGQATWNSTLGRLFAGVGLFSYSLYAVHAPLLLVYHAMISPSDLEHRFDTILPSLGGVIFVIPISYLFFRVVESWSITKAESKRKGHNDSTLSVLKS